MSDLWPFRGSGTAGRRHVAEWAFAIVACMWLIARADDDTAPVPEAINRAIDAGVAWLKSAQKEDGSWGPCIGGSSSYDRTNVSPICHRLGPTAFSIFTLTVCGVPREDAAIVRGLGWLQGAATRDHDYTSYESSALVLMLTALNGVGPSKRLVRSENRLRPPRGVRFASADWRWMDERVRHVIGCAYGTGGFGYGGDFEPRRPDVSATQFAVLALRAASFAGYPIEKARPDIWTSTVDFLTRAQRPSGGFPYESGYGPTRGMTAAALSSLIICREQMALLDEKEPSALASAIDKGFRYLDENFDVAANPSPHFEGQDSYHYCHLYALERTGMLSGRREFGGKAWYVHGARFLLGEQYASDGQWKDGTSMGPKDVLGTCFALLFLKKATIPAVTRRE